MVGKVVIVERLKLVSNIMVGGTMEVHPVAEQGQVGGLEVHLNPGDHVRYFLADEVVYFSLLNTSANAGM